MQKFCDIARTIRYAALYLFLTDSFANTCLLICGLLVAKILAFNYDLSVQLCLFYSPFC